jgi:hypothetical protein
MLKLSLLAENKVAITSSDLSHQSLVFVTTTAGKKGYGCFTKPIEDVARVHNICN